MCVWVSELFYNVVKTSANRPSETPTPRCRSINFYVQISAETATPHNTCQSKTKAINVQKSDKTLNYTHDATCVATSHRPKTRLTATSGPSRCPLGFKTWQCASNGLAYNTEQPRLQCQKARALRLGGFGSHSNLATVRHVHDPFTTCFKISSQRERQP